MRMCLLLAVGTCLALGLPWEAPAQEAECRAIIEKALKAQGGDKAVQSLKATHAKGKGTLHVMEMAIDFTLETYSNPPNQLKVVLQLSVMNMNIDVSTVINGDKGWTSAAGQVVELNAEQLKEAKQQIYVESVTNLFTLKEKDKGFSLSSLGESKVGESSALGVQVSKKDQRDVNLFFDKTTFLLLKAEYRAIEPISKQEVTQEKFFSDYKELIPGLKSAARQKLNNDGKKFLELELTEVRSVERHDASIFAKP